MSVFSNFTDTIKSLTGRGEEPNPYQSIEYNPRGDAVQELPWGTEETLKEQRKKHKTKFPWLSEPEKGVEWDFDPIILRNLAQSDPWIEMLISSITKEVAGTPWQIVKNESEVETSKSNDPFKRDLKKKQVASDSAAEAARNLIKSPNADIDTYDLFEMMMADLLEVGSTSVALHFPEKAYSGDELIATEIPPSELKVAPPETFTKQFKGKTGLLNGFWQYGRHNSSTGTVVSGRTAQKPIEFKKHELIWNDLNKRSNRRYGIPPTLMVRDLVSLLDLSLEQEKNYFARGSIPSGALVFENWSAEEIRDWKQENEHNIKGKPHKLLTLAGKEGDISFEDFSYNFEELQFMEREEWYSKIIASAFQVPLSVVGLKPSDVNRSTFSGERENFESNTLGPYLQKIERIINDQLINEFFGTDIRFEFIPGMSESQKRSISERVRNEFEAGLISKNEARKQVGYEELGGEMDGFREPESQISLETKNKNEGVVD